MPGELAISLNKGCSLSLSLDDKELLSGFRMGYVCKQKGKDAMAMTMEEHINEVCGIRSVGPVG